MKIETKFDIGDEVWAVVQLTHGAHLTGRYFVANDAAETITAIRYSSEGIEYELTCMEAAEQSIFPTKALAEAEAERRNG